MFRDVHPPAPFLGPDHARVRRDVDLLLAASGLGHLLSPPPWREKQQLLLLLLLGCLRVALGVVRAYVLAGFRGPVLAAA